MDKWEQMREELAGYNNEYLEKHGLVRLPVDADGRPWRPGDAISSNYRSERIQWLTYHGDGHWEYSAAHSEGPIEYAARPTPAERIRAFVDKHDGISDGMHWEDLLAIADELEGGAE